LKKHRAALAKQGQNSAKTRSRLACTAVADITPHLVQEYINALVQDGYKPATVALERAELRRFFNHARNVWLWQLSSRNPATNLRLPKVDNARDRIISNDEWQRLAAELAEYDNPYALPGLALLLETTMRSSEPLLRARWRDVHWSRCVLSLPDAKSGGRDVPLSPAAIQILHQLQETATTNAPEANILPTTYEALKKAWKVACQRAKVDSAKIHDLRHTGATRYALEYGGNIPVLQQITGHKTVQLLMRYVHIRADDVVRLMHGRAMGEGAAPAGLRLACQSESPAPPPQPPVPTTAELPANVVRISERRVA
jgi:integrase